MQKVLPAASSQAPVSNGLVSMSHARTAEEGKVKLRDPSPMSIEEWEVPSDPKLKPTTLVDELSKNPRLHGHALRVGPLSPRSPVSPGTLVHSFESPIVNGFMLDALAPRC